MKPGGDYGPEAGRKRTQRGVMLIEAIVYLAVLFLIMGLATGAFFRTLDHTRQVRRVAADTSRALAVGERWRQDVRAATAPPHLEAVGQLQALHIPATGGEVVYFFDGRAVTRTAGTNNGPQVVLTQVKTSDICRDVRERLTSWRWEIELATSRQRVRVAPLFSFEAVARVEARP
ncbi:MAG: hypothetical protein ABSC03_06945 [Verrucomicrobiota bacterium]|jgi:hypothetical protein